MQLFNIKRPLFVSVCLCFFICLCVLIETSFAATYLISDSDNVDGKPGNDEVYLDVRSSTRFDIEIVSASSGNFDKTYIFSGSIQVSDIYIESLDGGNGKEIIVLYTASDGLRKLCIINRSKAFYDTIPQSERWEYGHSIISQGLTTDYDPTRPMAVTNLVVTDLSGYAGKELIGVGTSRGSNFLFVIRYDDNSALGDNIAEDEYSFSGSVEQQFLIYNLDNYQGDEIIGFSMSGDKRSLYIVNHQLELDGYSRNYREKEEFSFGDGIQSSNIQVADSVAHFTTNNVVISNLGIHEPGYEIVGLYRDSSDRLGLFHIDYPASDYRVDDYTHMPGNGIYTGNYDRLGDARYTIGNFGTNGKEVYGYYENSSGDLGGAFVYYDNFSSSGTYQNLDNPDSNGNFSDSFHEQTSSGQTVASAIFSLIDPDGDGHHDGNDGCPKEDGYIDGDGDGVCQPLDQCDSNPTITSTGACGCDTSNQDDDQWLDCQEECDTDPLKRYPGICDCGTSDVDSDWDGVPDCNDGCPNDPNSIYANECISDNCPNDPYKYEPGICNCGYPDDDSDGDGVYDCNEDCPYDPDKTSRGVCGCFNNDADLDQDGQADCLSGTATEIKTFYHTDQTGTPLAVSDSQAHVIWRATYLPFGEEYSVDGPLKSNRRFIGKEKDVETGLSYFGARYLLTDYGTFGASDSVRVVNASTGEINATVLADPQRLNLYAYGLNNPYRFVDPDGNWAEAVFIEGPSIAVGIHSFVQNIKGGNYGDAAIDAGGIIADGAAVLAPGVPGGVGLGIKAKRASKYSGGAYGRLDRVPGIERHHMPANSISPISRHKGSAIQMDKADHALTSSYRSSRAAQAYRSKIAGMSPRDAMATEIRDVRRIGGRKYNQATRQMLDYAKRRGDLAK